MPAITPDNATAGEHPVAGEEILDLHPEEPK
jgi:hypothetical protein